MNTNRHFKPSNQSKAEYIDFSEEESDEYEGLEDLTERIKIMEATRLDAESSTSRVTLSEHTRTLMTAQTLAVTSNCFPSPAGSTFGLEMQVDVLSHMNISPGTAATQNLVPMSTLPARLTPATSVSRKRPLGSHELPNSTSPLSSQSAQPQPAKRPHSSTTVASPSPAVIDGFSSGILLNPFYIEHDMTVQKLLDEHQLSWGTVYEIARGVTKGHWSWSLVTKEKILKLRGTNVDAAHQVRAIILEHEAPPKTPAVAELWAEYDREQDAIIENKGRGLGGMGMWQGKDNWYGGRIQQVGRLIEQNGHFIIQLEKPEIRRSYRFSRLLGSRRLLRIKVSSDLLYKHGDEVRRLLSDSQFILCGRVYLPFHAKEGSMYMVETNENFERTANHQDGDQYRKPFMSFINWHNPLKSNDNQPISKWSTRWALGLSTSVPTIEFEPQHIHEIDDIVVSPKDWEGKIPAEKVLTDGCGLVNGAALTQIMRVMKYGKRPTAVQGRIGGSKGMWLLHPDPLEQGPDGPAKIWIRPSQTKIQLRKADKAQRIFDLLAPSRVTTPSRLSAQTLVNLSSNGIDHRILKELMARGLEEEIKPLIDWTHPQSMLFVWKAVESAGSIVMSRLRRLLIGQARALGLGQLHSMDDQSQESEDDDDPNHCYLFTDSGHKKYSGQPLSLHETVLELLQSGFHPIKLDLLFQKLERVIALVLDDYVEKFHIPIMESCEAYIVPDPYGVLDEKEIHFRSSEPIINPSTGEQLDIILGDVLVSRNPTRLPSDIQKVKAVAHPKLSHYLDVIVFPVKGKQSLASFLGGGDYDGDTVMLNWYKPLVEQFKGCSLCTSPSDLSSFFERKVEHVRDFDKRASKLPVKQGQEDFQKVLLLGLAESRVGLYSKFHDSAVYCCGYRSQDAIRLAYMFTTCLDASKTGLRVRHSVFENDAKQWGEKKPYYVWKLEQGKGSKESNSQIPFKRQGTPFILDDLVDEGDRLRTEALNNYGKLKARSTGEADQDLSRPWHIAKARAAQAKKQGISGLMENLNDIESHVEEADKIYQRAVALGKINGSSSSNSNTHYDQAASMFAMPPSFRSFVFFSDDDIPILKASFASTKSLSFAFSVAFHDLCTIKARATGHVAITNEFAQCVTIPGVVIRTFAQAHGADA